MFFPAAWHPKGVYLPKKLNPIIPVFIVWMEYLHH